MASPISIFFGFTGGAAFWLACSIELRLCRQSTTHACNSCTHRQQNKSEVPLIRGEWGKWRLLCSMDEGGHFHTPIYTATPIPFTPSSTTNTARISVWGVRACVRACVHAWTCNYESVTWPWLSSSSSPARGLVDSLSSSPLPSLPHRQRNKLNAYLPVWRRLWLTWCGCRSRGSADRLWLEYLRRGSINGGQPIIVSAQETLWTRKGGEELALPKV